MFLVLYQQATLPQLQVQTETLQKSAGSTQWYLGLGSVHAVRDAKSKHLLRHQLSSYGHLCQVASPKLLLRGGSFLMLPGLYSGERRPGTVGLPLPGVTVKVAPVPEDAKEGQQHANFHEGAS